MQRIVYERVALDEYYTFSSLVYYIVYYFAHWW